MRIVTIVLLLTVIIEVTVAIRDVKCEVKVIEVPVDIRFGTVFIKKVFCEFSEGIEIAEPSTLSNPVNESVTEFRMIRNTKINFLPQDLSRSFPKLHFIDAYGCSVKSLNKLNFNGLNEVVKIVLDDNKIETIDEDTFDDLSGLSYLYLDNNKIAELPTKLFEKLENLDTLYLNGNQLTKLDANMFKNNKKMALLHINENRLQTLPEGIFDGFTKMRQLWLKSNEIVELPANIFDQCESLIDIDLSRNKIKTIDPSLLTKLGELREVSFSFNPLDFIDLAIFDKNNLAGFYFNGIATKDIRNVDLVDQMRNIKEIGFYDGCVDEQFHEGNLDKLKEIVKMRCTAPVKA